MLDIRTAVFTVYGDGFRELPTPETPRNHIRVRFLDGRVDHLHEDDCLTAAQATSEARMLAELDVRRRTIEAQMFAETFGENIPDTTNWEGITDPAVLEDIRRRQSAVKKLFSTRPMRPHHINPLLYAWLVRCHDVNELDLYYSLPAPLLDAVNEYRTVVVGIGPYPDDFQTIRRGARKVDATGTYGIMGYVRFPKPPATVPFTFKRWSFVRGENQLVEDSFTPQPFGKNGTVEIGNYRLAWALESKMLGRVDYPHKKEGIDTPSPLELLLK